MGTFVSQTSSRFDFASSNEEEFTPETTIDQHDFEAIFLEEFATDGNVELEEAVPVERHMELYGQHKNVEVTLVSGPGPSRITNRASERIVTTTECERQGESKRPPKSFKSELHLQILRRIVSVEE